MNLLFAQLLIDAGIEVWRAIEGHPPGWKPGPEDFARLRRNNDARAADFERAQQTRELPPVPAS